MKFVKVLALAFVASASIGSTALAECFWGRGATGYEVTGRDSIRVRVTGREYYDLTLNFCPNLRWADRIGFQSRSSWVCEGDTLVLIDPWGRVTDRCWIDEIVRTERN